MRDKNLYSPQHSNLSATDHLKSLCETLTAPRVPVSSALIKFPRYLQDLNGFRIVHKQCKYTQSFDSLKVCLPLQYHFILTK